MDFFLITYDIADAGRRLKVANLLLDYGIRVQYSVFEVWLDKKHFRDLRKRLKKLIDTQNDSLRFYRLCVACREQVVEFGRGTLPEPPGPILV